MLDFDKLGKIAEECGFTTWGRLDVDTLEFKQEVRDMCQKNTCGKWNASWACPPACGTLEQMRQRVQGYKEGILVQTVGQLEDSFDWETIQETAQAQNENFRKMWDIIAQEYPNLMAMGTGACTNCQVCTYPDEPCRFPQRVAASMEGCGLVVNEVVSKNGMKYNHGPDTICYTGCFLLE
jgi:predicted metal-binding protein